MHLSSSVRSSALAAAALLAVAGCASSTTAKPAGSGGTSAGQPPAGPTVVAAVYTATAAQKTARVSLAFHVTEGSPSGQGSADVRLSGDGVVDFAGQRSSITMHAPTGENLEERLLANTAYVKLPPRLVAADPRLAGKSWLKSDLSRAKNATLGFGVSGSAGSDPTQVLRLLSNVADRVDNLGADTVRGAPATHYQAQLDLDKIAAKSGAIAAQVKSIETLLGGKTFPVDVWVDSEGRAVRLTFKFPPKPVASPPPGQPQIMVDATEEWYDFGTPVTVQTPPAGQVLDGAALLPGTGSRTGTTPAPAATPTPGTRA